MQNIQLLYDAYILDESVLESFYRSLLSNRVMSIPCMVVYQIPQSIPAGSTSFNFSAVRAFSRLSHVWLTFQGTGAKSSQFICPTAIDNDNAGNDPYLRDQAPGARLSIGPKFYPDPAPATTTPELFYMFQKALPGVPNMDRDDYLALHSQSPSTFAGCPQTQAALYRLVAAICSGSILRILPPMVQALAG